MCQPVCGLWQLKGISESYSNLCTFLLVTRGAASSELSHELSSLFREELVRIWGQAFALSCFSGGPWEMGMREMQSAKQGRS